MRYASLHGNDYLTNHVTENPHELHAEDHNNGLGTIAMHPVVSTVGRERSRGPGDEKNRAVRTRVHKSITSWRARLAAPT